MITNNEGVEIHPHVGTSTWQRVRNQIRTKEIVFYENSE